MGINGTCGKAKEGQDVLLSTSSVEGNCARTQSHFNTSSRIDEHGTWKESQRVTKSERISSFSSRTLWGFVVTAVKYRWESSRCRFTVVGCRERIKPLVIVALNSTADGVRGKRAHSSRDPRIEGAGGRMTNETGLDRDARIDSDPAICEVIKVNVCTTKNCSRKKKGGTMAEVATTGAGTDCWSGVLKLEDRAATGEFVNRVPDTWIFSILVLLSATWMARASDPGDRKWSSASWEAAAKKILVVCNMAFGQQRSRC